MSGPTIVADPAFGISVRTILDKDGRREIVFQLPVPLEVTDEKLNDWLDKIYRAVDRQAARVEMRELETMVEQYEEALPKFEEQLVEIRARAEHKWSSSGKRGEFTADKMPPAEQQAQKAIESKIASDRDVVKKTKVRIGKLKGVVNANGYDSGADRHAGVPDR